MKAFRSRRAFSLIELAMVLAVIGIAISALWYANTQAVFNNKVARSEAQLMEVVKNLRAAYSGRAFSGSINFADPTSTYTVGKEGWGPYFPADMVLASSNQPVLAIGLPVYVGVYGSTSGKSITMTINYTDVSLCAKLAPALSRAFAGELQYGLRTANFDYDISTPDVALSGCQGEFDDNGGSGDILLYLKL